jgi:hypothetical protein
MPALECIHKLLIVKNILLRFGQDRFQNFKLGYEASGVSWRIIPVQSELDAQLNDLGCNADKAHDSKWVSHCVLLHSSNDSLESFQ